MPKKQIFLCGIPFRMTNRGPIFCLSSNSNGARWGFHTIPFEPDNPQALLHACSQDLGLACSFRYTDPVDSFPTSRNEAPGLIHAFLLQVDVEYAVWGKRSQHRRLWCLSIEAHLRVRRKPIQRLIDNAVRKLEKAKA